MNTKKQRLICAFFIATCIAITSLMIFYRIVTNCGIRSVTNSIKPDVGDRDWWKRATFYHIYPRSFKDSNNDGVGDLKGIIDKLQHLKDAGITAAWLSPIYKSPQVDAGYDISDHFDIHEEYGTLEDFEELIRKANELGVKILMDFVPNHTSDQHEWFVKSEEGDLRYRDYYVWMDGKDGGPPNNWVSVFRNSAWAYSQKRKQYYLHQFTAQQPDLNFSNPKVVQEFMDILTFWLDKGVHGIRIDAIKHLFEKGFDDEPLSHDPNAVPNDYEYLDHIYICDQPESYEMVFKWRQLVDNYNIEHGGDERIMMTEAYTDFVSTMKYYGDRDRIGAHLSLNFFLIELIDASSTARDIVIVIKSWLTYMPFEFTPNWVLGNHDNTRIATRFGKGQVDGFNMLNALLPGAFFMYYGDEIGMENGEISWDECQDPKACNETLKHFHKVGRDFVRTPFHWDNTTNAGFNEGAKTWLPVSSKYITNNLKQQSEEGVWSHYRVFQTLLELRKNEVLTHGNVEIEAYSDDIIILKREVKNKNAFILVFNIGDKAEIVDLTKIFDVESELQVVVPCVNSSKNIGDLIKSNKVEIETNEGLVVVEIGNETGAVTTYLFRIAFLLLIILCVT